MKAETKRKISIIFFFLLSICIFIAIIFFTDTERQHTLQGDSGSYKVNEIVEMQVGQKIKLQDINPKFKKNFIDGTKEGYFVHSQDAYSLLVNKVEKGRSEQRTVFVDDNGYVNATQSGLYRLQYTVKCIQMRENSYGAMIRFPETYTFENTIFVSDNTWKDYEEFGDIKYNPYGKYILTRDITFIQSYAWARAYESPFYGTLINPYGYTITIDATHDSYLPAIFKENHGIIDGLKIKLVTNGDYENYFDTKYYGIVEENYGVLQNCQITGDLYVASKLTGIDFWTQDESSTVIYPMNGFVRNNTANLNVYTDGVIEGYNGNIYKLTDVDEEIRDTWLFQNNSISVNCNYFSDRISARQRQTNADMFQSDENGNSFVYANITEPVDTYRYGINFRVQRQDFAFVNDKSPYASYEWVQRGNTPLAVPWDIWREILWESEVGMEAQNLEVRYWLVNGKKYDRLDGIIITDDITIEPCVKWKYTRWEARGMSVGANGKTHHLEKIQNADEVLNVSKAEYDKELVQFNDGIFFELFNDPRNVVPEKIVFNKNVRHTPTIKNVFGYNDLRFLIGYQKAGGKLEFEAGNEELQLIDGKMLCKDGGKTLAYYFLGEGQTEVVLHPQIEAIVDEAFQYGGALVKSIDFSGVKKIESECFKQCPNVEELSFGKDFHVVNSYNHNDIVGLFLLFVVHEDSKIKKITIDPANPVYECIDNTYIVQRSDNALLVALPTLTGKVQIPDGITTATETAFCGSDIEELIFSDSFTDFQLSALHKMEKLKKITFGNPEKLQSLSSNSYFSGVIVPALTEIAFGDNIKELNFDSDIFQTANIGTVTLPKNLEWIESMFTYCDGFVYEGDNPNIMVHEGVLYNGTPLTTRLVAYPIRKTGTTYTVPVGTTNIDENAFENNTILEKVILPYTLRGIGAEAFRNSKIKEVNIENASSVSLYTSAFANSALEKFTVSEDTTLEIGTQVFYNCTNLKSFPYQNVGYICTAAFRHSGIEYFEFGENVELFGSDLFADSKIKKAVFTDSYAGNIVNGMFTDSEIEEIVVSAQTQIIQDKAFKGCVKLQSIALKNVTNINDRAFEGAGLQAVASDDVISLYGQVFKDCVALKTVQLNQMNLFFGGGTFEGCTALETVILPQIYTVPSNTFKNCTSLSTVKLGEGMLLHFFSSAFENCTSLKTIKGRIGNVYAYAFMNCTALEELYFSNNGNPDNNFESTAFSGVTQAVSLYMDVRIGFEFSWYAPENFTFYVPESFVEKFTDTVGENTRVIAYDFEKGQVA